MGLFSRVKTFFRRKKPTQLGTIFVKPSEAPQFKDPSKITVVDTSKPALSSVPSGNIQKQISRTTGSGGVSAPTPSTPQLAPEVKKELFKEPAIEPKKISLPEQQKLETQLKKIEAEIKTEPLGKPKTKIEKSKFKKVMHGISDVFTGTTYRTFIEHLSRPTSLTAPEIKTEFKESTEKARKETKLIGISPNFLTNIGLQQTLSAMKIRAEGEKTISAQTFQVKEINKIVKDIEKEQSKLSDTSQFTKEVATFEKEVANLEKEINKISKISNIRQFPERVSRAEKRRTDLLITREELLKEQKKFELEQQKFEKETISGLKDLRKIGVESEFTKAGEIKFTSKELERTVAPVGIKLQKSFLKEDKLTTKNILLGTTAIASEVGIAYGLGVLTGGTGAVARISSKLGKLPKVARIGIKTGAVGLAGLGITTTTLRGFQAGKVEGVGKIGAVIGGLTATGQIAGFGAGGFKGTKLHLAKIEKDILSGKTTKSIVDLKEGVTFEGKGKGGLARQLGLFETKIKGTKFKITSLAEVKSKFLKDIGASDVKIFSELKGKVPAGLPKKVKTFGATLETKDLIRLRAFTKVDKVKGFQRQDILISRKVLDFKATEIKSSFFKPFTKLERVKLISGIKTVGEPVKVKKIPKDIFTAGERFLFRVSKGKQKVASFGEFAEAKPDSIFASKQFIFSTKAIKVGDIKVAGFKTLAKSKGASAELLKESLKGKLLVLDLKTKQLTALPLDKKGQLAILRPPRLKVPEIKLPKKIGLDFRPSVDTKDLLKINLKKIVPQVLAREGRGIKAQLGATSLSAIGLKDLLKISIDQKAQLQLRSQIKSLSKLKVDLGFKVSQITQQKIVQAPALKVAQVPILKSITTPVTEPITTIAPPKVFVPVIPALPPIFLGKVRRKKKKKAGEKVFDPLVFSEGFTANVLDIKPRTLTKAEARKLLSTKLTGIGIRRAVIVR